MLIGYLNLYFWQIIPKRLRHLWYSIKVMVRGQHGSEGAVNRQHLSIGRSTCTSMQKTKSSICQKMSCGFSLLNLPFIQKISSTWKKKLYHNNWKVFFFLPELSWFSEQISAIRADACVASVFCVCTETYLLDLLIQSDILTALQFVCLFVFLGKG